MLGITGSKGFIGSHLRSYLEEKSIQYIEIEESSLETINSLSHIVHLASKTSVKNSWDDISGYIDSNVTYSAKIFELSRKLGASVTICSSYGLDMFENRCPTPYHLTKKFSDQLSQFYNENFSVPVTILKLANVFGIGQSDSFLIPTIISQLISDTTSEIVVENLNPSRSYIDVRDVVDCIYKSTLNVSKGKEGVSYFIGSKDTYSVEDLIKKCIFISGIQKPYSQKNQIRKNEIEIDMLKVSHDYFPNWEQSFTMDESLDHIIKSKLIDATST